MKRLTAILSFLWDFVVGEDWRVFLAVVAALAGTAVLVDAGVSAWWLVPLSVSTILAISVLMAADRRDK